MSARALLPAAAAAVLLLAACGGGASGTTAAAPASTAAEQAVPRLRSMAELRARFAAHAAEPQLLLLISPT